MAQCWGQWTCQKIFQLTNQVTFLFARKSGDLNNEHWNKGNISITNFNCWLFRCPIIGHYSSHNLNSELKVCYSSHQSSTINTINTQHIVNKGLIKHMVLSILLCTLKNQSLPGIWMSTYIFYNNNSNLVFQESLLNYCCTTVLEIVFDLRDL